mgnify:CR=1 FL=1
MKMLLAKVLPDADVSEVTMDTRLKEDLEFDSMTMLLMSMELEDYYGFRFTEFVPFETVGDVCSYLESRI